MKRLADLLRRGAGCVAVALAACSAGDARVLELASLPELGSAVAQPAPELKKVAPAEVPKYKPKDPAFSYVLGVDFGIRADDGGKGWFLAPRAHGKHNGIDFLAPVGTPVLAACAGKARADQRGGYGKVVQLVCKLPDHLGGDEGLHASFFYAHLDKSAPPKAWTHVRAGQRLGTVGKSGNAAGPKIRPHLHLELIIQESEERALAEKHAGLDKAGAAATDRFFELLAEDCLEPAKFRPARAELRRERRADPFALLMCAGQPKPDLADAPDERLKSAQIRWSEHYLAGGFDVDQGPR